MTTTPTQGAALSDADIDAVTDAQWGKGCAPNQYMAHRAAARAYIAADRRLTAEQGGADTMYVPTICGQAATQEEVDAYRAVLTTQPQAEPAVTDAMVDSYLIANTAYWHMTDAVPTPPGKWRTGNPREATRVSLMAALRSQPQAEPADEQVAALAYARNLAVAIHAKHYSHVTQWEPLKTVLGLLTQIDNMTCTLATPTAPTEPT